jgi:hypothetical protein
VGGRERVGRVGVDAEQRFVVGVAALERELRAGLDLGVDLGLGLEQLLLGRAGLEQTLAPGRDRVALLPEATSSRLRYLPPVSLLEWPQKR